MMRDPMRLLGGETRKPTSLRATLFRLWKWFRGYRIYLLVVLGLSLLGAWIQVETPDLIGQTVDCYLIPYTQQIAAGEGLGGMSQAGQDNCWYDSDIDQLSRSETASGVRGIIFLLVILYISGSVVAGLQFYLTRRAGLNVLRNMREAVFDHVHRLSLSYYTKNEAGEVMSRLVNDMEALQQAFSFALIEVIRGSLIVIWLIYAMLTRSVVFGLISMVAVPFMIITTVWFSQQARKAYRRARREIGEVNANLQENIAGVREAQAFSREQENITRFRETNAANRDANLRAVAFTSALAPTLQALGFVSIVIVAGVGGIFMLRDQTLGGTVISLGLIITFLSYTQQFNMPIQQIATLWANVQNAIAGAERIFEFLDVVPEVQDQPDAKVLPPIVGNVELRDVWMSYNSGEPVLQGVSLQAKPGQTIALVGATGAGKTTVINLLPRFYDVNSGAVLIDGFDVREVTQNSLRSQIGIVLQDTFLFSDTVMNNIRYGRIEATDEEVVAAAKLAHADGFISTLPDGYQTVLGERGSGLSQGQRQLLAIARAALANPRLLILDEATSSVDTRTERLIQRALEELLKGRTSFVIAHRLSTIRSADCVYVIHDGKVIEQGTHTELLAAKGSYYDLYMSQFRYQGSENGASNGTQAIESVPAGS
ncbi:MAG: ABC transporter ATP-binding protein [Chloroflexi bacterium]|nr:ABC transporter ATP-binding protein [Chloroflexota bacterium]